MAEKKKVKPISTVAAIVIALIAFAAMGTFLVYIFSSGGSGEVSGDTSLEQSFGDESSIAPERSEAEVKETMADANVGDAVIYGAYEQDGNTENGAEPIEWIVLEKNENELMLISRHCIEALPYNTEETSCEWNESSLYLWLNGEFLSKAFNDSERSFIVADGETSADMLSANQALEYYEYDSWRAAAATKHAQSKGLKEKDGHCLWWLTDKGEIENSASYVYFNGGIYNHGYAVDYENVGVRPVIHVAAEAETETEGVSTESIG